MDWGGLVDSGATANLRLLDLSGNTYVRPIPHEGTYRAEVFPSLVDLQIAGTDMSTAQNDTFLGIAGQLRNLQMSSASASPPSSVEISLSGTTKLLVAVPWFDVGRCPAGYYSSTGKSGFTGTCVRCPVGTYQPETGVMLMENSLEEICTVCSAGLVDVDEDPSTPCVDNPDVIEIIDATNDASGGAGDISYELYKEDVLATGVSDGNTNIINRTMWAYGITYYISPIDLVASVRGVQRPHTFKLVPMPPGFFINTDNGEILGVPRWRPGLDYSMTSTLFVASSGYNDAPLGTVRFEFRYHDLADQSTASGPNNLTCLNGVKVDDEPDGTAEFDLTFGCQCTVYTGDNCEIAPLAAASASSEEQDDTASAAFGTVFGAMVLVLLVTMLIRRRRIWLAISRLNKLANGVISVEQNVLNESIFEALHLHLDQLVPKLLEHGASAAARHSKTHLLPHAVALTRPAPDPELLLDLFRRHCNIDSTLGTLIHDPNKLAAIEAVLVELTAEGWRSGTSNGTTLHRVVDSCRRGAVSASLAVSLSKSILSVDSDLLTTKDMSNKTAGDYAMSIDDAVELERLLTVVVHSKYQLTRPSEQLYRSQTALVMECRNLSDHGETMDSTLVRRLRVSVVIDESGVDGVAAKDPVEDSAVPLVIKMMTDFNSWKREIESRATLMSTGSSIIPIHSIASSAKGTPSHIGQLVVVRQGNDPVERELHGLSIKLMRQYPYALCMERADRNLLECISNERLAAEPLVVIRATVSKIGKCVASLHALGVVHGDIK